MKVHYLFPMMFLSLFWGYGFKNLKSNPMNETFTYLALGDSYTIGEGVEESGRYPNQTVALLKEKGMGIELSGIIAKTGWTTDELSKGINDAGIRGNNYDLVTLLIGVNNQYRGRDIENYKMEFKSLLQDAITFAKGNANHVVVISIPDWGVTPFALARGTDKEKVGTEIDTYNQANKNIAEELGVHYLEITERYREIGALPQMVVEDKLHPSDLIYKEWAEQLVQIIGEKMAFN
ncbi:SGNH/GDSL hydrolase family protein [Cyclobacteriaceae bacterium YHN15]|jgi:lysophospholipase L1-like esterase|nr:SGNH/GDSL hydrolase family protein [Cyclobacteriaceae bacterium YHN15]